MTTYKGLRFRILNNHTGEVVEVSASDSVAALHKVGWINYPTLIVHLGRKIWLNEPKRYIKPTRDFYG